MNDHIDIQALRDEVDKLQSIAFAAATLQRYGQVDFDNTVELLKISHRKIGVLLYPLPPLDGDFPDTPELLTPHTP